MTVENVKRYFYSYGGSYALPNSSLGSSVFGNQPQGV